MNASRALWCLPLLALLACKTGGKNIHKTKLVEQQGSEDDQAYSILLPKGAETSAASQWKLKDSEVELEVAFSPNTILRKEPFYRGNGTFGSGTKILEREDSGKAFSAVYFTDGPLPVVGAIVNRATTSSTATGCSAKITYQSKEVAEASQAAHGAYLKQICESARRTDR